MRRFTLVFAFALIAGLGGGLAGPATVAADGPSPSARAAVLEALPQADQSFGQSVTISVRLVNAQREALKAVPISFYVLSPMFGGRLMKIGEVPTNAVGIASIVYRPTWVGPHKAMARFAGDGDYEQVSTPITFNAAGPAAVYHGHPFGLDPIRTWLPLAGIGLVLIVWGSLGYVVLTTVTGVRGGALSHRALLQSPLPKFTSPWAERPASMRRGLLVFVVVGTVAAAAVVLVLPRGGDDGIEETVPGSASPGATDRLANEIQVRLDRSVSTLAMDENGQFSPESATLAPSLAIGKNQIFILDRVKGRIMNVTDDGTLSQWMASGPPTGTEQPMPGGMVGGVSIRGAAAMAVHADKIYVANTFAGNVVVVSPPGAVQAVLQPQVPGADNPLSLSGIVVAPNGDIWLSDRANHRVLSLNGKGEFGGVIGEGKASTGPHGLNSPGGIGLDTSGNVYVVDEGNARVMKYSPLGVPLLEIGAGVLIQPRDVAVDELGRIFVADAARSAIVVFGPEAHAADHSATALPVAVVIGSITRERASDASSQPWFEAPEVVRVHERTLYVLDRMAGLKVFDLGAGWMSP